MKLTLAFCLAGPIVLALAGCGGGGAGSASASGCGGSGFGGSGTVYPAGAAYSVPFSSQAISGSLGFPASQVCQQASASASTALPSGVSAVPVQSGETVLTIITVHMAADFNTEAPTTITFPLPDAKLATKTFAVYDADPNDPWRNIGYVGSVSWSDTLTLTSDQLVYAGLGDNYFAITTGRPAAAPAPAPTWPPQ